MDGRRAIQGEIPEKNRHLPRGSWPCRSYFRNDSNESMKVSLDRIRLSFQIDQDNRPGSTGIDSRSSGGPTLKPGGRP